MSNPQTRSWVVPVIGVVALFLLVVWPWSAYNRLVQMDENINAAWAQVENQMQRRYDLIPNLVETVKGYAKHEKEVYSAIADARSRYAGASTPAQKIEASNQMEAALARLLVIVEQYPELKANQNFTQLQDELAGTENRLATERMRYNEQVQTFNGTIRRIPYNIMANLFGLGQRDYFKAAPSAQEAPKVNF